MRYLVTLLFATLSLNAVGQVPDYVPAGGLVAWYPFNGNANDESGNGLHGTVSGAILAPDQNGNNSSAYYFDGDDKIEIAHNNILNVTEMTLRISFKTFDNPLATPNGNSLLMSKREPSGWGSSFEFSGSASFGSSWSINGNGSIAGPNLMHGNWYDVVYVHRNDSIKIYIHNVLVFEDVSPGVYNSNSLPLVFGMRGNGWHQLIGTLDDIGIWNRALTEDEIESLFVAQETTLDCTDSVACNFNPDATEDDGSCDYTCCPGPGCCGVGMNWNSEIGECEITNPTDSNLDGCTDLNDLLNLLGAYGICTSALPDFVTCGDLIEHEGYSYSTVQIGGQCWFAENCRYLPVVSPSSYSSTTDPDYYVYGYEGIDVVAAQATTNFETYGVLYNWPAVMDEGICPSGWHVPTDGEFTELVDFLGGESVAGGKMKEAGDDHWDLPNIDASNSSGFNGLPGGSRYAGGFITNGDKGYWWSASVTSPGSSGSLRRRLDSNSGSISRGSYTRNYGFSVRCVKDES